MREKSFLIYLCKQEYEITTSISFGDLRRIEEALKDDTTNYQRFFADLICKKIIIENKPTIEEIYADSNLKKCAEEYISTDDKIESFYKINSEKMDFYKAVLQSIYEKFNEELQEMAKGFPKISNGMLEGLATSLKAISESMAKIVTPSVIENITKMTVLVSKSFERITINIAEMLKDIKLPTISEERKAELIISYKAWGTYGWTMMPNMPLRGFGDCPVDIKEANKIALKLCTGREMERLFDILRGMDGVKKTDLEEAIFDFKHKQYKSCALVLFGLIDAKIIRLQRKDNGPNGRRAVGKRAANKVMQKIKNEQNLEKRFFLLLDYENILACFNTVFADAEDFRKQPVVINRNFVDHGMMTKKVIRKDCVQLFLLYYNLLMFLDVVK